MINIEDDWKHILLEGVKKAEPNFVEEVSLIPLQVES